MELKKSKKADLERDRRAFLQIGLVVTLSLSLIAFNWKTDEDQFSQVKEISGSIFEPEIIQITIREKPKPEIIENKLKDILTIVPDDILIMDDFDFDAEVNPEDRFDIDRFIDTKEEFVEIVTFLPIEDMPRFNGGDPAIEFRKYISQNLKYPDIAIENEVSGKVYVQFLINPKGKLIEATIVGPIDPALDKEALRVINSSPLWEPGNQRGKPVKVLYTFPINFVLK